MAIRLKNIIEDFRIERKPAKRVFDLIRFKVEPDRELINDKYRPYHDYDDITYRMLEINILLETYGVEYIRHDDDGYRIGETYGIDYCNVGHSDRPTIMYDHMRRCFRYACWEDVINGKLGNER